MKSINKLPLCSKREKFSKNLSKYYLKKEISLLGDSEKKTGLYFINNSGKCDKESKKDESWVNTSRFDY